MSIFPSCCLTCPHFLAWQTTVINDGSLRVFDDQGHVLFHILFLEVKEDTGGANPAMEIGAYYGRFMYSQYSKPEGPAASVLCTCCPAFGLELSGNVFRWVSGDVCMEQLTYRFLIFSTVTYVRLICMEPLTFCS